MSEPPMFTCAVCGYEGWDEESHWQTIARLESDPAWDWRPVCGSCTIAEAKELVVWDGEVT